MSKPRKPKGRPISGWLILDKPVDFGSTEAVGKIKWLFNAQKAGHAGTLDPLASCMLPIALGEELRGSVVIDNRPGIHISDTPLSTAVDNVVDERAGTATVEHAKRPGTRGISRDQ